MNYLLSGVVFTSWVFWLWETYLDYRQYRVYITTKKVPKELDEHIDNETFEKSRTYSIDKARFGFITSLIGQLQTTVTLCCYLMPYFWRMSGGMMATHLGLEKPHTAEWEIFQSIIFSFITSLITTLINLPFSVYNTFVIEEKHGFNKQTATFYAWDKFKSFLVNFMIATPILVAVIYITRNGGPNLVFYLWGLTSFVTFLLIFFQGEIAAIFDKFTPLPDGILRSRIEELARGLNFPLWNIFIVEGSKRSSHSNAYQSGFFNRKRIVIYDTLIADSQTVNDSDKQDDQGGAENSGKRRKGCNNDEVMAVICHELGHWYHSHLFWGLIRVQIQFGFMFYAFSMLYKDQEFYAAFGFNKEMPAVIGLTLTTMVLMPVNELFGFISTYFGRKYEYEADSFSKNKNYAVHLKKALIKLQIDNLGFPVHDHLYSMFNHTHPTLIQRLKALDKVD